MYARIFMATLLSGLTITLGLVEAQGRASGPQEAPLHPLSLMHYCAANVLPCGLEINERDAHLASLALPDELRSLAGQPVQRVITTFNEHQTRYRAALLEGVLVVRPTQAAAAYLDSILQVGVIEARGLMDLAKRVFVPLDPGLARPGGVGSRLSSPNAFPDDGSHVEMIVDGSRRSVISVLNEIVRRAPNHAWVVTSSNETMPAVLRFGFVDRDGGTQEMYVAH